MNFEMRICISKWFFSQKLANSFNVLRVTGWLLALRAGGETVLILSWIQYIRYMKNRKFSLKNQPADEGQSFYITRNPNNQNLVPQVYRTERKNSVGGRGCLAELPLNQFDSGSKVIGACDVPRQASIDAKKCGGKASGTTLNGSRWLDNDKEMMEFILNLKSKRSEGKTASMRKGSEGFEFEERREEREEMVCNRMLVIKKVEKYEKEAISCFYEKEYERCFGELGKAQGLIKKEKIDTPQHQLYINYLYAQFYYKLEEKDKWKVYLIRARSYVGKITSNEASSMKEYIMNIKALEICLALQDEQFQKVLRYAEELREQGTLSSKIRRRVSTAEIAAFRKLCKYKNAIETIDRECGALQHDSEINEDKRDIELAKLLQTKIQVTAEFVSNQKAIELVQKIIGFEAVSQGQKQIFSYYNFKIYHMFSQLLRKSQAESIKLIFFYEKWLDMQQSKKQKLKIWLELFKIYYDLGIYERALQLFDQISSENIIYLGPEYLFMLAKIKHFHGQDKQAISIVTKIIDICVDQETKMLYLYRILQFNLQEQGAHLRQERESILQKALKNCDHVSCEKVLELYGEYLREKGDGERAKAYLNMFKKTANFNGPCSWTDIKERRYFNKK